MLLLLAKVFNLESSHVSYHYTHSDHQAIVIEVATESRRSTNKPQSPASLNARSFDRESFNVMMAEDIQLRRQLNSCPRSY